MSTEETPQTPRRDLRSSYAEIQREYDAAPGYIKAFATFAATAIIVLVVLAAIGGLARIVLEVWSW